MMAMNKRGVFWVVDGELVAFPFDETATQGIAKSGKTYNHKLLWEYIKPRNKPFDYYPRGRVDYNAKGKAIIYMNPNISAEYIDKIKIAFGIDSEPVIRYDGMIYDRKDRLIEYFDNVVMPDNIEFHIRDFA